VLRKRIQEFGIEALARMIRRFYPATATQTTFRLRLVVLIIVGSASFGRGQTVDNTTGNRDIHGPGWPSQPTGASRCVFCHAAEVEGYARSAMAHSLRRAAQEPEGTVSARGAKITMHSSPSGYAQVWESGADKSEYRVDYVIGSGNHASGYLVDIAGHLFQSPVAYYTSRHSYDLAPGYENLSSPDFTRPVSEGCVLCHSGTALNISGTLNQYRSPIFPAEAITCERCHGPVQRHLADPRAGSIVNPAKLEPAARDSICEQCHLFGVARVPNPGKTFSDFIPGQRLEDTFTIYHDVAPPGSSAGAFKVISHVEQLALSVCARKSGGRLWCGTCHNPHDKPLQPVEYYRARCLSCHTASFPDSHPARDSDCLGCHMPKREAKDGGHTAFTDHRIQRRPEPESNSPSDFGIAAWREPSPDLQDRNRGIAQIEVGTQRHSAPLVDEGYRTLTKVQQQFTHDSEFFKWIGQSLLQTDQTSLAKSAFNHALDLDPNSALTEGSAALPYLQEGDFDRARPHLERALALDPLYLPAASALMDLYQKQGKTGEAAALMDKMKTGMSETSAPEQRAQLAPAQGSEQKSEEVFKNIQVLKAIPANQLIPAMEFISSSLGVHCSFCHVEGHFEKDDKKPKQTARKMMQMMLTLNQKNFEGRREVTCYTCHRGARDPIATPVVDGEPQPGGGPRNSETQQLPANLPTASQLIDNYVSALGGANALEKITSRVEKGTANIRGQSASFQIFTKAPDQQTRVSHLPDGDSLTIFDGSSGWFVNPRRAPREMQPADLAAARMDADLRLPLHIQQWFPELHVEYPEKISGREAHVLFCIREDQSSAKFYFDEETGLLLRLVRYTDSPLGLDPTQIDYADYRDVDGVKVPFQVTVSQPGSGSTFQIEEVRDNIAIDDGKFAKPSVAQ